MVSSLTFAGGLLTNTNQNVAFLRNPARDGAIGIDGVYSNPAGVAFLPDGLHLSLNFQSAYQTREITSVFGPFAYGAGNRGESSKLFKGDAKAPVVPSLQAAYNRGRWSYSFNFAIGGGGGKCAFEDGLGSFESQAALLPLLGKDMGINSYSLDSYMRGRQYYYGFQIGAAYKITDNLSAFVGGRLVYATTNYYGYVKNISVNNPVGGEMVGASAWFAGQMAPIFLAMGIIAGIVGGIKGNDICKVYISGCKSMMFACLVIGMGRGILIVMEQGMIFHTILNALAKVLSMMPPSCIAVGMFLMNIVINLFVPSGSGLAALVMPLMGPLAQMTGITAQTAVVAFQCAAGFSDCVIPTSSTTNACIGAGGISFVQWFRFAIKLALIEWGLSIVFIVIATLIHLA